MSLDPVYQKMKERSISSWCCCWGKSVTDRRKKQKKYFRFSTKLKEMLNNEVELCLLLSKYSEQSQRALQKE